MAVTLIDLETPTRHRPGEAPVWRMGRALAGRRRRESLTVAVAVLVLAVLGGSGVSQAAEFPALHPVGPAATQVRYAVGADFVFATDGRSVSAYSLVSGETVWRLEARPITSVRAVAGVVIVGVAAETSGTEVFAVDERTGRRSWTHPGVVAEGTESAALVVVRNGRNLSAYAPVTGELAWQRTFRVFGTAPVADGPPRLLVQEYAVLNNGDELYLPRSLLSLVDITTGAVTPVGSLAYHSAAMLGVGDPLAVISSRHDPEAERAYVQGGLAAQSDRAWQSAADPDLFRQSAWACGGLLCTSQGNLTAAIDPASGAQVWRADAEWVNHRTMRVDGADLLVAVRRGETGPNTLLLDPRTGQVRRDLANWSPLVAYRGRQLVLWVPDSRSTDSWLGYLDPTAPRGVRPMFPIGAAMRCSATDRWLFCESLGGGGQAAVLRLDALDRMLR